MSEREHMKEILERTGLYAAGEGTLLNAELSAYAEGLDLLFDELDEMERECFIETAETYGLTIREGMLRRLNFDTSLSGRRSRLMDALSITVNDGTAADMAKVCGSFNVNGDFTVESSPLTVVFTASTPMSSAESLLLEAQMRRFMPPWASFSLT